MSEHSTTPLGSGTDELSARLDRLPVGFFHHWLAIVLAAGLIVDSIDIAVGASASGALLSQGFADLDGLARLALTTTFGLAVGGVVAGYLADKFGRVAILRLTMALIIVSALGCALAGDLNTLIAWRFVGALGLGGETILAYGMLTEFMPRATRGRWIAWVAVMASAGLPLSLGVGAILLPLEHGWRWLFATPGLLGVLILVLRWRLPESPRWLSVRGRAAEAEAIVGALSAGRGAATALESPSPAHATYRDQGPLWRRFVTAASIQCAAMCAIYGFVSWLPTFLVAEGRDVGNAAVFSAIMTAGGPAGAVIAFLIADRFERKWSIVACAGASIAFGALYAGIDGPVVVLVLGCLTVTAIYAFGTLGLMSYMPELFETSIRLRVLGVLSAIGRGAGILTPLAVPPLFVFAGQAGVLALIMSALALCAFVVAALGPATRGRSA